ncbi:hypothetical protein [Streptomyces sp. ODS28]|uniref:HIT family protein n=1 Tax=Streptomyces sp. ODS28 TaxID=3136688 RepID=UPI0031EA6479
MTYDDREAGGAAGCQACQLITGEAPLPGGTVHRTERWTVEHCVGPLGVGTMVVKPLRHVVRLADLVPEEAAELGPLLQRVSGALDAVLEPEQVYACLWSHAGAVPGHIHFVVQPVSGEDMGEHEAYGPALQTAMFLAGRLPDAARVEEVCERVREALRRG